LILRPSCAQSQAAWLMKAAGAFLGLPRE
jgi:hypothetical protein